MSEEKKSGVAAPPLMKTIDRAQMWFRSVEVDRLLEADHPARLLWETIGGLDLSGYYEGIKRNEEQGGRPATHPQLLIALWVYAYSRGIGAAREIERRCQYDPAFWWLTGMEKVNHHTLSDFRVQKKEELDELFAQVLGAASVEGFINLEQVTLDGTKIKACASGKSFRREETLQAHLEKAREVVRQLEEAAEEEESKRQAAEQRAREKVERLQLALEEMEKLREQKKSEEAKREARVSMSDPEARIMKQNEGGFAPSYNVQIASDTVQGLIVDVETTQAGNDFGQLIPAVERMEERFGKAPEQVLVDTGYISRENVEAVAQHQVDLLGSLADDAAKKGERGQQRYAPDVFVYDAEQDYYVCPAGKILSYEGQQKKDGMQQSKYKAKNQDCRSCPLKTYCCPGNKKHGRSLTRSQESPAMMAFRAKMKTEAAQAEYRKRGAIAEFRNLWIKAKLGLRQFHVRGLEKVRCEALWACLTHNLQHWIRLRRQKTALLVTV
ncbi:MAG TPA: IS1182 family transposase [Candidatus Angelobacter sp.]